jgi:hypothetical protein
MFPMMKQAGAMMRKHGRDENLRIISMIARAGSLACAVSGQCQYHVTSSDPGEEQPRCNQEPEVKTVEHAIIFSVKHFQSPSRTQLR